MSEKVSITKSKLDSLANAIAAVGETSVPKTIAQMESAVLELTIPPNLQSKTITPSLTQQIVSPDSGYDAFSQVTVNAIELQEKTVTPTTEQQIVTPDSIEYTYELSEGLQQAGAGTSSMYFTENKIQQAQYFIVGTSYKTEGEVTLSTGTVITFGYTDVATSKQQGATTTSTLQPTYDYTGPTEISGVGLSKIGNSYVYLIIEYTGVTEAPTGIITKEVQIYEDGQANYDGLSKVTVNGIPSANGVSF